MQETSKNKPLTLEQRLEPWIEQGEYLIVLVITIMAWTGGWVNLIAFESWNPTILGRYSPSFFALLTIYTAMFVVWFWLVISLQALGRFKSIIAFFQRNPLLYALVWVGFGFLLWTMTAFQVWLALPLLQVTLLIVMTLFSGLVLFAKPSQDAPLQLWRKVAWVALLALVLLEASLQLLASAGHYPVALDGTEVAYGRVYQTEETIVNDATNLYGWFYPEFRLEEETERILLLGDTYIQALQVPKTEHLGLQLEAALNQASDDNQQTEVIAHGMAGYGAYNYLSNLYWPILWEPVAPDTFIIFVQPTNDLDLWLTADQPTSEVRSDGGNRTYLEPTRFGFAQWHTLGHQISGPYDPINPLLVLYHRSLTWNLINALLPADQTPFERPLAAVSSTPEAPFGRAMPLYDTAASADADRIYNEFTLQLRLFVEYMTELGIEVKLVTIPYFPASFYEQSEAEWSSTLGEYDLLEPEERLVDIAQSLGIPTLALGPQWQASTSRSMVQSYFTMNGTGRFSIAGHQAVANLVYDCFFTDVTLEHCSNN